MGFSELSMSLDILTYLESIQFFSLFLGLILSIILTILFILSVMLLYSLLMISVETRTFELGVHRMVGLGRKGVVSLLITQAGSFSVPAWLLGLLLSAWISGFTISALETAVQVPLHRGLTPGSIIAATLLGLLIPLVASILPIRAALSQVYIYIYICIYMYVGLLLELLGLLLGLLGLLLWLLLSDSPIYNK